jgi:N-methylhydantoinase B
VQLEFRVLAPQTIVTARGMERCYFEPWGAQGGNAASRTRAFVGRAGEELQQLNGAIDVLHLGPGDVVRLEAAGGGGYGPRLERDPAAVVTDVRSGLLSASTVRDAYGVVLSADDPAGFDDDATRDWRACVGGTEATSSSIDFGPTRREYEKVWTPEVADAIAARLQQQPLALRSWARRQVHERVGGGDVHPLEAWETVTDQLTVLSTHIRNGD